MKPDWDKLAKEYDGSETVLIADVDCTEGDNKDLCSKMGVRGYPTIKLYPEGDTEGEAYEGGRDLKSLKKAAAALGPSCSVKNYDLCDAKEKAAIDELKKLTPKERLAQIATVGQLRRLKGSRSPSRLNPRPAIPLCPVFFTLNPFLPRPPLRPRKPSRPWRPSSRRILRGSRPPTRALWRTRTRRSKPSRSR